MCLTGSSIKQKPVLTDIVTALHFESSHSECVISGCERDLDAGEMLGWVISGCHVEVEAEKYDLVAGIGNCLLLYKRKTT